MNGEVNCQKVLQREFKGTAYIITLKADSSGLSLDLENKYTGDAWECYYDPQYIEKITIKASNNKKYNKFVDMLVKALPENYAGDGYELFIDLLTHHDLELQTMKKSGVANRTTDPIIVNRKYLILSYISTYDKAHYPIPLEFVTDPSPQRLKLAIRRLSQEIEYYESDPNTNSMIKEVSMLRHENQLIKSKLKSVHRQESKENVSVNVVSKELQEENDRLRQELAGLKASRDQEIGRKNKIIEEKDRKIADYQTKIRELQRNNDQYDQYEEKFTNLAKETHEMASALQHSKENQKKSQLKITNLEKELQKMMSQLKKKTNTMSNSNMLNSPRRSDNGSVKSINSNKRTIQNKSNNKGGPRKSSIYDSDTESSKMRKQNNGRVSPYRQSSRPLNTSNSAKKKQAQRTTAISKYSNISNLYGKDRNRNRSRSKSKSVKKQLSPPSDNFQSSAVMTEEGLGYPSDDEDDNKVSDTMARLQNYKKRKAMQNQGRVKNKVNQKQKKMSINPIQQKISSIASMMRSFKNNRSNAELLDNKN